MTEEALTDCLDCGACCYAAGDRYVSVSGDDHERMGGSASELTRFHGNRCFMRMEDGHCAALRLMDGRHICEVYEIRPAVCRDLEQGTPACEAERERKLPISRT